MKAKILEDLKDLELTGEIIETPTHTDIVFPDHKQGNMFLLLSSFAENDQYKFARPTTKKLRIFKL